MVSADRGAACLHRELPGSSAGGILGLSVPWLPLPRFPTLREHLRGGSSRASRPNGCTGSVQKDYRIEEHSHENHNHQGGCCRRSDVGTRAGTRPSTAYAQRGVGDPKGIACRVVKREVVSVTGKLIEIRTSLSEATTGRSTVGTHLIVETADGKKLNVHLGPADAVADTVAKLSVGQDVAVEAFRTDNMKTEDFVARSITSGRPGSNSGMRSFVPSGHGVTPALEVPGGGQGGPGGR